MVEPRNEPESTPAESNRIDSLTLGLVVYFVALIVLVAGLLVLPLIF